MITFSQLEAITGGKIIQQVTDPTVKSLAIDSRKINSPEGVLFFAIAGQRHNAHHHLQEVYQKGVRLLVVEEMIKGKDYPEANILHVSSAIHALQEVARNHRQQFKLKTIAITGSNGKTIVKEWLSQILSKFYPVAKNPGSYNSQVGVPLSVWTIQPYHQVGIFEAGISRPGEMEKLESVIQPMYGVFTNLGSAHNEGFSDQEQKAEEKLKLFRNVECLLYCKDHSAIDRAVLKSKIKTFTWGRSKESDVVITPEASGYSIVYNTTSFTLELPFSDPASVENIFHCVTVMLKLGFGPGDIHEGVRQLRAVSMRLELKEGVNHCQIIDDTYNNDLAGLEISLLYLTHQHQRTRKSLVLSDILESGLSDKRIAEHIASLVNPQSLFRVVGIGPVLKKYRDLFHASSLFYETTDEFINSFEFDKLQDEVLLIKGARAFKFEKIVHRLQRKVHGTIMEIDLNALVSNLNFFRTKVKPTTKLMVMVKAFAYGSGSNEIANLLQYHRADYLGVAYADEGVDLRKNNISLPIMVMNPSEESFDTLLQFGLEPEVYSFKILNAFLKFLGGRPHKIHVKLDTGMHRLGFEETELPELIQLLGQNKNVTVASVFSHLAGADEKEHDAFSRAQAARFVHWADKLSTSLGYKPLYHILNSPGILRLPDLQFDMVRLGIGLYGVDPTSDGFTELKPAATLKTFVSQIKKIPKGDSIGYARKGVAEHEMKIATLAIGYADGFSRAFSRGKGQVLIHGQKVPVIGNVCMDMTMVDVTHVAAEEGDEVIVFGPGLPIQEVAAQINTIPYEILTSTSERVKRVFVSEGI